MTLNDITVKQIMEVQNINPTTLDGQRKLIQCIFGIDPANLPFDEFLLKTAEIPEIFKVGDRSFKKDIEVSGVKLTARAIDQLSTREFIDFDTLAKEGNTALPTLLAIIYTNEHYSKMEYIAGVKEKAALLMDLDAGTALGAIYQVRGYDMSNVSFIQTNNGWIVFDVLMCKEDMAAAKELMEKNPAMKEAMTKMKAFLAGAGN